MRRIEQPPVPPSFLPPGRAITLPGRGETFARVHDGGEPGAPWVLLLHGWTASADTQWFTLYEALGAKFPFVALDHRGHGRGMRSDQEFRLEDAADDAAALVRTLGVGPVITMGYSMGGPISLLLAQRHPDLVRGLVLEATSLEFNATRRDRAKWVMLPLLETVLRSRFSRRPTLHALRKASKQHPAVEPWFPWLFAEARRGDAAALIEAGRALRTYDFQPFVTTLDKPAGVLLTTKDKLVRPIKQRQLADALNAEIEEVRGDHFVAWLSPDEFARASVRLITSVARRSEPPSVAAAQPATGQPSVEQPTVAAAAANVAAAIVGKAENVSSTSSPSRRPQAAR